MTLQDNPAVCTSVMYTTLALLYVAWITNLWRIQTSETL